MILIQLIFLTLLSPADWTSCNREPVQQGDPASVDAETARIESDCQEVDNAQNQFQRLAIQLSAKDYKAKLKNLTADARKSYLAIKVEFERAARLSITPTSESVKAIDLFALNVEKYSLSFQTADLQFSGLPRPNPNTYQEFIRLLSSPNLSPQLKLGGQNLLKNMPDYIKGTSQVINPLKAPFESLRNGADILIATKRRGIVQSGRVLIDNFIQKSFAPVRAEIAANQIKATLQERLRLTKLVGESQIQALRGVIITPKNRLQVAEELLDEAKVHATGPVGALLKSFFADQKSRLTGARASIEKIPVGAAYDRVLKNTRDAIATLSTHTGEEDPVADVLLEAKSRLDGIEKAQVLDAQADGFRRLRQLALEQLYLALKETMEKAVK